MSEYEAPFNKPIHMLERGWNRLRDVDRPSEEWYWKEIAEEGLKMLVVLRKTPSGRIQAFVSDPPEEFVQAAHSGMCLRDTNLIDSDEAQEVHFGTEPDTLGGAAYHLREIIRENA